MSTSSGYAIRLTACTSQSLLCCLARRVRCCLRDERCAAEDKVTYDDHVAPIFRQRCSSCHSPTTKKADLDVTNYLEP